MAVPVEQLAGTSSMASQPFRWQEDEGTSGRINVGPTERWLSLIAGGALAAYALRRRTTASGAAAFAGAAFLYRGATGHCHFYEALGVNHSRRHASESGTGVIADRGSDTRARLGGHRGTLVDEAVTINRDIAEVYRFWRNFENFPRFMRHLESVAVREAGISHWVAKGPAGTTVEWDARIIHDVENKLIGWQSIEGSQVATAGSVNFDETPRGTSVRVRLQYSPPAGKLGSAIAWMFGEEPGQQIREDLRRFKALLETGEIPTTAGQPSGRSASAPSTLFRAGRS